MHDRAGLGLRGAVAFHTRRLDLIEKHALYAREGVGNLWFVDPDARTLRAFEFREEHWLLLATLVDDAAVSLPPFDAITRSMPSSPR